MLIDERRFDFLPKNKWDNLNSEDKSNLQSFRVIMGGIRGHLTILRNW